MAELRFEIKKSLGCISDEKGGWAKELNLVSWNGNDPKYDIRSWDDSHEKMGKGITLSADDAKALKALLDAEE
jgi:hypothetical protein